MAAHDDDLFSDNDYHIRYWSFWFCDVAQVSIIP
jgi:hypothetical protein